MIDKLEIAEHRFEDIARLLTQPDLMNDIKKFTALSKEYKELEKLVLIFREYRTILKNYEESRELFLTEKYSEMRQMAK
jgi:peptide chain release factor 1